MDVNASIIVQMLVFIVFVGLTMKFIWPAIIKALETRQKSIVDGLAAAEKGHKKLKLAEMQAEKQLIKAKEKATYMIEQASQNAHYIIAKAKNKAREEGKYLIQLAKNEIEQEYNVTRAKLLKQMSSIAVISAQKILQREIDRTSNDRLVDELANEI